MATNLQNPNALGAAAKPANPGTKVDQYVGKQLKKTTQQVRMSDMVAGFLTLAAYVLGFFLIAAIVDAWIWPLSNSGRLLALAVFLVGLFGIAWFYLLPFLFRKINPQYAAKMIEEAKPEFKNSLLNYLSIRRDKKSTHRAILSEVSRRAATDLSSVSPDAMVDKSNVIRTGFVLVGLVATFIGYSIFSPKSPLPTVMRVLAPGAKISKPAAVRIDEVTPGDASVFFGDRPEVTAKVYGVGPEDEVRLVYSTKDSQIVDASIVMEPTAATASSTRGGSGSYRAILSPGPTGVQQPLVYRIEAGDGISPTFGIEVRPNPSISIESIKVTPPSYTGLPERTIEGNGEIQAVEGSHVEIEAKSNLPIEIAYIVPLVAKSDEPDNSEYREMRTIQMQADQTQAVGRLVAALNANRDRQQFTHYKINFRSTNNYRNERPNIYPIRVIADLAPEVEIVEPGATELTIPVNQPLPVEIWAADLDYEISSIDLHVEHQGSRILNQNLIKNPADKSAGERISVRHVFTPQDLRLEPGDTAIMFASASDNRISPSSELPDPNVSRTANYTLIVTDLIENPKPSPQNQDKQRQAPQQRKDPNEQEQADNSATNQQEQETRRSPEEQQEAEQGQDDSGDADEQNSGSDEGEQQQSGSGSQQQGNSGSEQSASDQSDGEQGQQSQSGSEQADSESGGNENANDQNESQSGNSGESSRAESGSNGQQSREGNAGEFQNSDSSEQGAEASSNSGTENGTANDATNSSNGQRGANQNQRGSGDHEFRDESLTDGEVEPLPENAPEGDQFERLQKYFEENKENQSQQSRNPNSSNDSGDENGGQNSQENAGNRNETADDGQPSNEGGRPSSPGEDQQPQPGDPAGENSSAQPNASDRSDSNPSGSDSQSGNQPEQQNSGEDAADGNPEQPASNGAESQNGTPDPNQSGSGSRSQPDSEGEQSANPGESGSPDAQSTPGAGSESQDGGGSGEQPESNSEQSQGSGEQSGNSEAGSQDSQDAQSSDSPGSQSDSNPSSESSGNSESSQQPSDSSSSNSSRQSGGSGESGQSGNSDSQSSQSASESGAQSPGDSSSQPNGDQQSQSSDSNEVGESANSNSSSSSQDPTKFGGVGGAGEENPNNSGPDGPSQADKPNLDYAKKVTDLVLDQLEDQKYDPDQKLLDQMNWTKEDLAQFLKRWQQMRDKAGSGDVRSKREYENGLNSLGIFPESKSRVAKGVQEKEFRLNESGAVDQIPAEYVDRFNSFLRRRNRSKRK